MSHDKSQLPSSAKPFWGSRFSLGLKVFGTIGAYLLLSEHRAAPSLQSRRIDRETMNGQYSSTHCGQTVRNIRSRLASAFVAVAVVLSIAPASAHDDTPKATAFGRPGTPAAASRTVAVRLTDAMRFDPGTLHFSRGETVRLRISNIGVLPHEFVLGTKHEIAEHAELMRKMPGMVHADASSARVAPGKTVDLVWQFTAPGTFFFACLVPGHWEAGMQGTVVVSAPVKR